MPPRPPARRLTTRFSFFFVPVPRGGPRHTLRETVSAPSADARRARRPAQLPPRVAARGRLRHAPALFERRRLRAACARLLTEHQELNGGRPRQPRPASPGHWHTAGEAPQRPRREPARGGGGRGRPRAGGGRSAVRACAGPEGRRGGRRPRSRHQPSRRARPRRPGFFPATRTKRVALLDDALALADPTREPVRTGSLRSAAAVVPVGGRRRGTGDLRGSHGRSSPDSRRPSSRSELAHAVTDLAYTEMLNGRSRRDAHDRRGGGRARPPRRRPASWRASRSTCSGARSAGSATAPLRSTGCARRSHSRARPAGRRRSGAPT